MNNLDLRERNPELPKSENMLQYAFNKYNGSNLMESIRNTPIIYRTVNQGIRAYKAEENKEKVNTETPIVTAQEIKDIIKEEMYCR